MSGLIQTGVNYESNALSGFVRESAQQKEIDDANRQIQAQKKMQENQMIGEAAGVGLGIFGAAGGWAWLGAALF